jgi:release factor glutamine methyltransferase
MNILLDEIAVAAARLAEAGVESPRADAELIAAHLHGVSRGELHLVPDAAFDPRFWDDIARREAREPLQHITGLAYFRYLDLEVGPGVFVPRQETEVMTGWAIETLAAMDVAEPVVADLGTGSGAIALAIAQEAPRAIVHAVEADPLARHWARRNLERCAAAAPHTAGRVHLHDGDFAVALPELDGSVDLVISNPPYIPLGAGVRADRPPPDAPRRRRGRRARRAAGRGGVLGVRRGTRLARAPQPRRPGRARQVRDRDLALTVTGCRS